MATRNGNGNGGGDNGDKPAISRGRRITADDLSRAAEAAQKAAQAASDAAEAVVVALEHGDIDESVIGRSEEIGVSPLPPEQEAEPGKLAFEEFMAQLSGALRRAGNTVDISENAAWVKIESRKNGHKVYVAKGKTSVNRVESTLPHNLVAGATEPDRKNGRIASFIPADPKAVSEAIRHLAQDEEQIRPPQRGGGNPPSRGGQGGPPGSGGRRPQKKFN